MNAMTKGTGSPENVPPAVAKEAARIDALVAEQAKQRAARPAPPPPEPIQPSPPEAPPAPTSQETFREAPPPAPTPESNSPPEPDYKHQYDSMKGRMEREASEKRALLQQVSDYQRLLATMETAPPARADVRFEEFLTPKEREEYGLDMLDVMGRRAKEIVSPELQTLRNELEGLKRQVGGVTSVVAQDARERMFQELDSALPNWKTINDDPKFLAWLALPDAFSGVIRHTLLNQAVAGNQTSRVQRFFDGFLADEATTSPARATRPNPGAPAPEIDLETLAAPGRARQSGNASVPPEKPTFTRAQVAKFYRDSNSGAYQGREADKIAIEKQIFVALREGRVI